MRIARARGDDDAALAYCERAKARNPFLVAAYRLAIQLQLERGHPDAARRPLERALRFAPGSRELLELARGS